MLTRYEPQTPTCLSAFSNAHAYPERLPCGELVGGRELNQGRWRARRFPAHAARWQTTKQATTVRDESTSSMLGLLPHALPTSTPLTLNQAPTRLRGANAHRLRQETGMNSTIPERAEAGVFAELFDLDVRVEPGQPLGSCNSTDNGCSGSCTSVGCSKTCNCK